MDMNGFPNIFFQFFKRIRQDKVSFSNTFSTNEYKNKKTLSYLIIAVLKSRILMIEIEFDRMEVKDFCW